MTATKPRQAKVNSGRANDAPVIQSARSLFSAMLRGSHRNRALVADAIASATKRPRAVVEEWYEGTSLPEPHEVPAIACALNVSPAHVAVVWMMTKVPELVLGLAELAPGEEFKELERMTLDDLR